ncbi:MAG: tRNA N6-adenosine(37)-N6-threonylcarbamoyltransferase complex dimerization subunit TsaB [Dehalococcoides mccartyi]|uniref:tRNA (adenosine(37)-N6)-threonylcarbamoyltransferase complex dimerization subunit type 1 TsaB n=1 Tax=Dehalococcoides mccartyi TaxID=61435 RepID=UPI00080581B7|nr:tRNA (adenosine(37)-N6)-threonylcarbamoyltransferase complex dimerization subunit type 1 TsaB [Dehalococcoides mccartyi]OBW63008.1 MAG: tRNA N6-adenosine(37)-N6-threonylcarbamoyltransferase complex dimerization subunit TsaB [Dehalococcoides mccartyi]
MPVLIAIDTATPDTGLAILRDNEIVAQYNWLSHQNQTVELLPRLDWLLESAGLSLKDATAIAVSIGPGSFNGLRIGLSTAKSLAYALDIPLCGIGTLELAAYPYLASGLTVWALLPSGQQEYAAGAYTKNGADLKEEIKPHITSLANLAAKITEPCVICGPISQNVQTEFKTLLGDKKTVFAPADIRPSRAVSLARLAKKRIEDGLTDNPAGLQPLYLRRPQISPRKHPTGLPLSQNKAVIWDMDGVIADSAPLHFRAWQTTFTEMGYTFSEADFYRTFGLRNDMIIYSVLGEKSEADIIHTLADRKEHLFREYAGQDIKIFPGVMDLLKSLKAAGYRMAIASSAPLANIKLVMTKLGIGDYFLATISEKDVTKGKPNPQVFLLSAARLCTRPEECLVIEDAPGGVEAAKKAGMKCLAVTNSQQPETLKEADLIVDTLGKIGVEDIAGFIGSPGAK